MALNNKYIINIMYCSVICSTIGGQKPYLTSKKSQKSSVWIEPFICKDMVYK